MRLKLALEETKGFQISQKERRKEKYDSEVQAKGSSVQVGDFVLGKVENRKKLEDVYKGPYEVIRTDGSNANVLRKREELKIHKDNLKIFYNVLSFWLENA